MVTEFSLRFPSFLSCLTLFLPCRFPWIQLFLVLLFSLYYWSEMNIIRGWYTATPLSMAADTPCCLPPLSCFIYYRFERQSRRLHYRRELFSIASPTIFSHYHTPHYWYLRMDCLPRVCLLPPPNIASLHACFITDIFIWILLMLFAFLLWLDFAFLVYFLAFMTFIAARRLLSLIFISRLRLIGLHMLQLFTSHHYTLSLLHIYFWY